MCLCLQTACCLQDDLPLSPKKPDVAFEPRGSSQERSPSPLPMAEAGRSLGPPNAGNQVSLD